MGSIFYDHKARRAFETETRRNPTTGAPERYCTKEIPYDGDSPIGAPTSPSKPFEPLTQEQASRLRQDVQTFLSGADDSPLGPTDRDELARRLAWQREHGK